jgi:Domain of unknown function (DUF5668)/B-box zinc finger
MNCANHPNVEAVAYCRTCGKPLCSACRRDVRGVIYCENCLAARMEGTVAPVMPAAPVQGVPGAGPNPTVAGILAGFFPFGVGAVYTSQYAKGLAHLLIFAGLIWGTDHTGGAEAIFGIGFAFFYVYQIIDAVRSARAIQLGQPAPDPFGLGQALGSGERIDTSKVPTGAVILIVVGLLFLLHTAGVFEFGFERIWPVFLIALGAWLFVRGWGLTGTSAPGRCYCEKCRMRRLTGPAVLFTVGMVFLLDSVGAISAGKTWPAIILVIGIVKLLQNNASSAQHIAELPPSPPSGGTTIDANPPVPPAPANEVRNV